MDDNLFDAPAICHDDNIFIVRNSHMDGTFYRDIAWILNYFV